MDQHSIEAQWQRLTEGRDMGNTLRLAFGDVLIEVAASVPELIGHLRDYFRGFHCEDGREPDMRVVAIEAPDFTSEHTFQVKRPDPGKRKIKEEYLDLPGGRIVRKRLTNMHFYFGGSYNLAVGPCLHNVNQVVNFINNRYIQWRLNRGCLLGHAAGVLVNGCGIAVAGFSGAGKSTLALHLMSRGATFVSNDRLLIWKQGRGLAMSGVAKLPRINPGTALNNPDLSGIIPPEQRHTFEQLSGAALRDLEHKYDVPIDEVFGPGRFRLQATMHLLVILNWQHVDAPCIVHDVGIVGRHDLLGAFIKSPGLFYQPGPEVPEWQLSRNAYVDHLTRCRVIECFGGVDFERAASHCLDLGGQLSAVNG